MTVAPLQLPGPLTVPTIDWKPLNEVGDAYVKNQEQERLASALGGIAQDLATRGTPTTAPAAGTPTAPTTPGGPPGGQLPRGLRNNNPGNIEDGPLAKSLPGYKGPEPGEGRFATFDTPENGLNAMDALLTSYGRRGDKTVSDVINRWAPKNPKDPGNDPDAYARFVSPNGDPNAPIDLSDPAQRRQLVGKMAIFENGMHGSMGMTAPAAPPSQAQVAEAAGKMPPELAKRVEALGKVGSPLATQLAISIIGKYIGNQEPLIIPRGGMAINRNTGTTIASNPESQFELKDVETQSGIKTPMLVNKNTGALRAPTPQELQVIQQGGELPPELIPKVAREAQSKAYVANQEQMVEGAKAAADFKPQIDQAVIAYEKAIKAGGIGPIVGGTPSRFGAAIIGTDAEKARQDYDTALAGINNRISALQLKGQGSVSNFERQMASSQFPTLTKLDPADQIKYLKKLQADTDQTIAAGKELMLGKQPGTVLTRPAVEAGKTAPPPAPAGPAPEQIKAAQANPQGAIDAARAAIAAGKDRAAVVQHLQQLQIPIPPGL